MPILSPYLHIIFHDYVGKLCPNELRAERGDDDESRWIKGWKVRMTKRTPLGMLR